MSTLKNWIFSLTVFGAVFAYTGIANSLELHHPAGLNSETAAEEKSKEESKAEEKASEAEKNPEN